MKDLKRRGRPRKQDKPVNVVKPVIEKTDTREKLTFSREQFPIQLTHANGCKGAAFLYHHIPMPAEKIRADLAIWPDGSYIEDGERILCANCKKQLDAKDMQLGYFEARK